MEQKIEKISTITGNGGKEVSIFRIPNSTNDFIELSTAGCTLKSMRVHGANGEMQELIAQPGEPLFQLGKLTGVLSDAVWEVAEVGDQHVFLTCRAAAEKTGLGCEITVGAKVMWVNLNRLVVDLYITPAGNVFLEPAAVIAFNSKKTHECDVRTFCPEYIANGETKKTGDGEFKDLAFVTIKDTTTFAFAAEHDVAPMFELTEAIEKIAISGYGDMENAIIEPKNDSVRVMQCPAAPLALKSGDTWTARVIYGIDRTFTKEELENPAPSPFSVFFG